MFSFKAGYIEKRESPFWPPYTNSVAAIDTPLERFSQYYKLSLYGIL